METMKSGGKLTRLPHWMRKQLRSSDEVLELKKALKDKHLHTVCQSAGCPNITQCFQKPTATFMILGNSCTRQCRFCGVPKGSPEALDPNEPRHVAEAAKKLGLKHVVVTSVTRDDLFDGGSAQFVATVKAIKSLLPTASVEVLTPDFKGRHVDLESVVLSGIDIFNHNVETIPRLYKTIRPEALFERSLDLIKTAKQISSQVLTKSGLMVGLGETYDEVIEVLEKLRCVECDAVTIGQYLTPSRDSYPVQEYITPDTFENYKSDAEAIGFRWVNAGPFVRSSYNAEEMIMNLKEHRVE